MSRSTDDRASRPSRARRRSARRPAPLGAPRARAAGPQSIPSVSRARSIGPCPAGPCGGDRGIADTARRRPCGSTPLSDLVGARIRPDGSPCAAIVAEAVALARRRRDEHRSRRVPISGAGDTMHRCGLTRSQRSGASRSASEAVRIVCRTSVGHAAALARAADVADRRAPSCSSSGLEDVVEVAADHAASAAGW